MATTKQRMAEIGGFEDLADHFTDDHELGHRIAALGYRVEIATQPVDTVYPETSMKEYFRHQLRWSLAIRHAAPAGYLGRIFVHAIFWMLVGIAAAPSFDNRCGLSGGLFDFAAFDGLDGGGLGVARSAFARGILWRLPVHDACAFFVYVSSFFTRRVEWRGTVYNIRGKELIPVTVDSARVSARG